MHGAGKGEPGRRPEGATAGPGLANDFDRLPEEAPGRLLGRPRKRRQCPRRPDGARQDAAVFPEGEGLDVRRADINTDEVVHLKSQPHDADGEDAPISCRRLGVTCAEIICDASKSCQSRGGKGEDRRHEEGPTKAGAGTTHRMDLDFYFASANRYIIPGSVNRNGAPACDSWVSAITRSSFSISPS